MNKQIPILALLMGTPLSESPGIIGASPITSSEIAAEDHRFGGKKAQNKRNRRTKRINRKNGIGMLPVVKWEEVNHG